MSLLGGKEKETETQLINGPDQPINQLKIEGPISLSPNYAIREYEISIGQIGEGTISGEGNYTFDDNGTKLISASPATGWYFDRWSGDSSYLSSAESPNPTFSLPLTGPAEQELNYNAIFSQFDHQIQATALGDGSVRLKIGNSNWGNFDSNVSNFVNALGTVFLEANASEGYEFVRWDNLPSPDDLYDDNYSLNDTNSSVYFSPSSDHNISATFAKKTFTLTVENVAGRGEGNGSGIKRGCVG